MGEVYPSFNIDIEKIAETILRNGYKKVLLQMPEGLKRGAPDMIEILEKRTGASFILDGDICFGACDHSGSKAGALGLDALIHLGHADIPSMERDTSVPIHFFPVQMKADIRALENSVRELISHLDVTRIGLATTVQHMDLIEPVRSTLMRGGMDVHIGLPGKREAFPGQVLGCSFHSARSVSNRVDVYLYIGTGKFHPMGLFLSVRKDVFCLDPMTGRITRFHENDLENMLRVRHSLIARARELIDGEAMVGIIVCSKPGQMRCELAASLEDELKGKEVGSHTIVMDHITPMKVRGLGLRLIVSTACPRIAIDDHLSYSDEGVTILTPGEMRMVLDGDGMEGYTLDEEW